MIEIEEVEYFVNPTAAKEISLGVSTVVLERLVDNVHLSLPLAVVLTGIKENGIIDHLADK